MHDVQGLFIQNKIENIFIMNYNPNKHDDFHLKTTNKLFQNVNKVFSAIQRIFNVERAGWQNFKKIKVFVHCLQKYKLHKLYSDSCMILRNLYQI